MKLNKHYKTLLILGLVLGPFIWLVLSADGQRRSDLVMLALLTDREPLNLSLANLRAEFSEEDFRRILPEISFQCTDQDNHPSSRACFAAIAAVNGAPAQSVSLYFQDGSLDAVELLFQPAHHDYLLQRLQYDLGPPSRNGEAPENRGVHSWDTPHGRVLLQLNRDSRKAPTLLWVSNTSLKKPSPAG